MENESSLHDLEHEGMAEQQAPPRTGNGLDYDQITGRMAAWSFWLGIISVVIYQLLVIPIAAFVLGIMAVARNDPGRLTGKWRAWVGLILGGLYTLTGLLAWLRALAHALRG